MKPDEQNLDRLVHTPNREIRVVGSLVIFVLAVGFAMLWPSVQHAVVERFGPNFPSFTLVAELLVLVGLFVAYLWRKSCQVENLVREVVSGRNRNSRLETHFAQARSVLQASGELKLDEDASESLQKILQCVIDALQASRGVLWRLRGNGRPLEREAVFPSTEEAPDPLELAFEDAIAKNVVASGSMMTVEEETDLKEIGIALMRPSGCAKRMVAAPLLVDGKPAGVMLLCDPELSVPTENAEGVVDDRLELLEIFVGFASGVLRNLRKFQLVAKRNDELNRARKLLDDHQRELAEIDAVATMSRVARSLAHGLSGPLTAIAGYTDIVVTGKPDELTLQGAREGLRREIGALKKRLRQVVEFTQTWRRQYTIVDLNNVVETAVVLQAESMRVRNITCQFEPHPGLPFTVADPARLRQVFLSVLGFVRNTMASERSAQEIRVRTLADTGRLRVHVDFRGKSGMPELASPLLDPNVEIATLARERSIDLPVAVAIVRDHQGELTIETLEDKSTRIVVDLPIQDDAPEVPANCNPDEKGRNFESILSRIFSENIVAPRTAASTPAASFPSSADAAEKPARIAQGAPATPVVANGPAETDTGGIDSLFNATELWKGEAVPAKVETPAVRRPNARRTLLDEAEVEGALKLFDDAASIEPTAPDEPAS